MEQKSNFQFISIIVLILMYLFTKKSVVNSPEQKTKTSSKAPVLNLKEVAPNSYEYFQKDSVSTSENYTCN